MNSASTSALAPVNNEFHFGDEVIRVFSVDGEPWFVGKDVAGVLGYADSDKALRMHCKAARTFKADTLAALGLANPPSRGLVLISEPDLYRLISRSTKPEAERFADWIFCEVLPQIRRTGRYMPETRTELEIARDLLAMNQKYVEKLEEAALLLQQIETPSWSPARR